MSAWVLVPVIGPLAAAAITALGRRSRVIQRTVSFATVVGVVVAGAVLLSVDGMPPVSLLGGWPPRFGIVLVGDPLAALLVTATGVLSTAVLVFAVAGADDHHPFFHPLTLVLIAGACGSFLTGDLFNLFVFFEVALIASYVLTVLEATGRQVRAAAVYVTTNLLGSLLLLVSVGWTYAAQGTVSYAALVQAGPLPVVIGGVLLVALGIKAAVVPLGGWLPITYRAAPRTVAALFAGLLTTVGVVGIYRIQAFVLQGAGIYRVIVLVIAAVTLGIGALAAAGRSSAEETVSFVVIAQVGFMLLGPGLFSTVGVTAGVFFVVQDVLVKTAVFLAVGTARDVAGCAAGASLRDARPVLVASYLVAALSLAGLPPPSGFFGKLLTLQAMFADGQNALAAIALIASLLVLLALLQPWKALFTASPEQVDTRAAGPGPTRIRIGRTAPVAVLCGAAVLIGVWPGWLHGHAQHAASFLVDPLRYAQAVLR